MNNYVGDAGGNKVIVQRVPNYEIHCARRDNPTAKAFDGTSGGVLALRVSGTLNVAGTIMSQRGTVGGMVALMRS